MNFTQIIFWGFGSCLRCSAQSFGGLGKYSKMKIGIFCIQWHEGGEGVRAGEKRTQRFFKKVFFQKPYRIILGPPKHVLHLVWSVLGIYTAIITALKVAFYDFFDGPPTPLNSQLMEKENHYNCTKKIDFSMGPSVKFVLAIIDSISKKNGCKFFYP